MLSPFDWLRRSQTGAELLATLRWLAGNPEVPGIGDLAAPFSALAAPCERCWLYARPADNPRAHYCDACHAILGGARPLGVISRRAVVLWGYVNQLPRQLRYSNADFKDSEILGAFAPDDQHFLIMLNRKQLKPWFQELMLYHGANLKGLIQIFPTAGATAHLSMDEVLCRIIHNEARFPLDQLRVRFFFAWKQIFAPHQADRQGILTFDAGEFMSMLEMASVFRTLLRPEEQKIVHELLTMEESDEAQFYWGRLVGYLSTETRDMLNAWKVRRWSAAQTRLFYELAAHVEYYQSNE